MKFIVIIGRNKFVIKISFFGCKFNFLIKIVCIEENEMCNILRVICE